MLAARKDNQRPRSDGQQSAPGWPPQPLDQLECQPIQAGTDSSITEKARNDESFSQVDEARGV